MEKKFLLSFGPALFDNLCEVCREDDKRASYVPLKLSLNYPICQRRFVSSFKLSNLICFQNRQVPVQAIDNHRLSSAAPV